MSYNWVYDIAAMHSQLGLDKAHDKLDSDKLASFIEFRLRFLQEELNEAKEATSAEDVVDAMIDLCVVAIGTLDAVGVDSYEAWNRVLKANLAKKPGIKPERPNPLGLPDLMKPEGWEAPTHADNVGRLAEIF